MFLFYHPHIENNNFLPEEEVNHCIKVLRKNEGDTIQITDGKGFLYKVEIISIKGKKCVFKILEKVKSLANRKTYLHIAIAPTKNLDRMEWFIEKAVELGVDEITFLRTQNSERREIKIERLEKKAVSAMKQSLQSKLPIINDMSDLKKFEPKNQHKIIAHLNGGSAHISNFLNLDDVCVFIGAEGGFTDEEIEYLVKKMSCKIAHLGSSRLRTETAALKVCALFG